MTKVVRGGRDRFLDLVVKAALDGDETAKTWWATWEILKVTQQRIASFDDICAASGIKPSEFMAMIIATSMETDQAATEFVAQTFRHKVVRRMAKSAMRIGGQYAEIAQKDRHVFLQGRGFLPVPRSATMTVNVSANASANAKAAAAAASEPSMPDFLGDMQSLQGPKSAIQRELTGDIVDVDE